MPSVVGGEILGWFEVNTRQVANNVIVLDPI